MGKYLIALDTNHIKQYVFATDRLKDIRGASSILDELNRKMMVETANKYRAEHIYTNGGSGMFVIDGDEEQARQFGYTIQKEYTKNGASITFAIQPIPKGADYQDGDIKNELDLLTLRLQLAKTRPSGTLVLPSHPLLRPCDSCGKEYASHKNIESDDLEDRDPDEAQKLYCTTCLSKRREDEAIRKGIMIDGRVREGIATIIRERRRIKDEALNSKYSYIWAKFIGGLQQETYTIPHNTQRPSDFNELRGIAGSKDYLALIYADGNGMGKAISKLKNTKQREQFADNVDGSIYQALIDAINAHLKVDTTSDPPMFPFDILMIGGDDIMLVTPAAYALDVASTIAKRFHQITKEKDPEKKGYTLSVGIVLAPIKYPFRLLQDLAETTLKFAKKEGEKTPKLSEYGKTRINFLVVAGSTSHDFKDVYNHLHTKDKLTHNQVKDTRAAFYATLRPYTVEEFDTLLQTIREGKRLLLGRTKLHQIREAVLHMNLTTAVGEALAVLRNWKPRQRKHILQEVYSVGARNQANHSDPSDPASLFPRVTFPWFADGDNTYRTPLLDFVELYDFVTLDGGINDTNE